LNLCLKLIVELVEILWFLEMNNHLRSDRVISPSDLASLDRRDHCVANPVHQQIDNSHCGQDLLLAHRMQLHMVKLPFLEHSLCHSNIRLEDFAADKENVLRPRV
jgi:hypothetical protein